MLRMRLSSLPESSEETVLLQSYGFRILTRIVHRESFHPLPGTYEYGEHYLSHFDENGLCPVLEAEMRFHTPAKPQWQTMRIGIPLTLYNAAQQDVVFVYDGLHMHWLANGFVVNENFPYGQRVSNGEAPFCKPEAFACLEVCEDPNALSRREEWQEIDSSFAYYTPFGYNAWAGDVTNLYHDGVYHLVYFLDRHHHQNRWGTGAHYLHHVTTRDFINWVDHGPMYELQQPWQSFGTGTLFVWQGKLHHSHGFHTERYVAADDMGSQLFLKQYEQTGETNALSFDDIFAQGKTPSGSTYMVSEDGEHFRQSRQQFHWVRNPSLYNMGDHLKMYSGDGVWQAPDVHGPWTLITRDFPPIIPHAVMHNTAECPSCFEWNGYRYLIMGATGFWQTEKHSDTFYDSALLGYDVYDGLYVPMVTTIPGDRKILGGWIHQLGWGSFIVHRELIQYPNGRLGMKWMPELDPLAQQETILQLENPSLDTVINCEYGETVGWEMEITPGENAQRFAIRFEGEAGCELQLDFANERAQFHSFDGSWAKRIEPACTAIPAAQADPALRYSQLNLPLHWEGGDFSIAHVDVMKARFCLRILQRFSPKANATLIDAEINGQRTIITNRPGLHVQRISLAAEGPVQINSLRMTTAEQETRLY